MMNKRLNKLPGSRPLERKEQGLPWLPFCFSLQSFEIEVKFDNDFGRIYADIYSRPLFHYVSKYNQCVTVS